MREEEDFKMPIACRDAEATGDPKRVLVWGGRVKGNSGWSGVPGQRQKRQLALSCIAGVEQDEVVVLEEKWDSGRE